MNVVSKGGYGDNSQEHDLFEMRNWMGVGSYFDNLTKASYVIGVQVRD